MVREFQRVISTEARAQVLDAYGELPYAVAACVGGGSNAMGMFADFIDDAGVKLYGFEAGGDGVETGRHASSITGGSIGVLHGMRTYVLQDEDGQTVESHSISAGLDYPGVGPEHAWLAASGRGTYEPVTDAEAMDAFKLITRPRASCPPSSPPTASPAPSASATASPRSSPTSSRSSVVCLSGRGDKDVATALTWFGLDGTPDARPWGARNGSGASTRAAPAGCCIAAAKAEGRAAWSATCPSATPTSRPRWTPSGPWLAGVKAPASTWSRSACRTPTR